MHTLARPAPSDATGRTGQRACTPRTRGSGWHTSGQPLAAWGARPAAPPRLVDPCGGPPRPVVGPRAARARRASARAPDTRPRCRGAGNDCREAPRCTASCSAGTPCTRPPTAGASAPPEARLVQPPAPLAHLRGWASVPRSLPPHATERALLARHAIRRPPRASAAATWRAAPSPRSRESELKGLKLRSAPKEKLYLPVGPTPFGVPSKKNYIYLPVGPTPFGVPSDAKHVISRKHVFRNLPWTPKKSVSKKSAELKAL